jgi:ParB family transcriptional regulator, chromosome partitioning protein
LNLDPQLVGATAKAAIASVSAVRMTGAIEVLYNDVKILPGFNPRLPNPERPNEEDEEIALLADSFVENGFYADMPLAGLAVREGGRVVIYITNGHRRMKAIAIANSRGACIETIFVVLKPEETNMDDINVAFVRSADGKRLKPLEIAIIVKRLSVSGNADAVIGKRLGITPEYVDDLKFLCGAPSKIFYMVQCNQISAAAAITAMRSHGSEAVEILGRALDKAKELGKTKVTPKYLPAHIQKREVQKRAPTMYAIVQRVHSNPAFHAFPDDLRADIEALLTAMASALPSDLLSGTSTTSKASTHE